ncbi:MAG TPA: hypothetical protein VMR41_04675 [Patescibacteria group bacterium]|nr:hypothetical protein [Patescibacteria group bacterium]
MEIALLSANSLRLKGKNTTFVVNPQDKNTSYAAAVVFYSTKENLKINPDAVVIDGAGDYEIGGIKLMASRFENDIIYSFIIDDVSVLLADLKVVSKNHQKLKDYDIVAAYITSDEDPSSAINLASSAVLFFGEKAAESVKKTVKEGLQEMNKYSVTKDKLTTEVAQILLK